MNKSIYYFGTDTRSAGHYFWHITENSIYGSTLAFPDGSDKGITKWSNHPFDAEALPISKTNGDVEFHFINGYSICAICGSPADKRPGCKSVFFVKGKISNEGLKEHIMSLLPAKEIIDKMPFEVRWPTPIALPTSVVQTESKFNEQLCALVREGKMAIHNNDKDKISPLVEYVFDAGGVHGTCAFYRKDFGEQAGWRGVANTDLPTRPVSDFYLPVVHTTETKEGEVMKFIGIKVKYDNYGQYLWGVNKEGEQQMIAELRGFGAIQNLFKDKSGKVDMDKAAKFQDSVGEWIAKTITDNLK